MKQKGEQAVSQMLKGASMKMRRSGRGLEWVGAPMREPRAGFSLFGRADLSEEKGKPNKLFNARDISQKKLEWIKTISDIRILRLPYLELRFRGKELSMIYASKIFTSFHVKIPIKRIAKQIDIITKFEDLKFKKGFVYTILFKCSICGRVKKMRIKNLDKKRDTPICKHIQLLGSQTIPIYGWIRKGDLLSRGIVGYWGGVNRGVRDISQKMFLEKITVRRVKK